MNYLLFAAHILPSVCTQTLEDKELKWLEIHTLDTWSASTWALFILITFESMHGKSYTKRTNALHTICIMAFSILASNSRI